MQKAISLLFILFALTLSNCSYSTNYNASYISEELANVSQTIDGKALIFTETKEDEKVYNQKPSSLTGGGTTLSAKVGEVLRNISLEVFSKKFSEGAYHSNNLDDTENYSIVIKPEVLNYDYRYNQLKNLGFAITPEVKIDLFVFLYDKQRKLLLEKKYESEYLSGGSYLASFSPHEKVNKAIHMTIYNLLNEVSYDIEATLLRQASK
jgi:hypothetical protein